MKYLSPTLLMTALACSCNLDYRVEGERLGYNPRHQDQFEPVNPVQVDTFHRPAPTSVDILFVIDRSCSMKDDNANLSLNIDLFFNALHDYNLNYHVGIIPTSRYSKLLGWGGYDFITPSVDLPGVHFRNMINYNPNDGGEAGLEALKGTFRLNSNVGFFRAGTPLRIIFISDENDQSSSTSSGSVINYLEDEVMPRRDFDLGVHGVLFLGGASCGNSEWIESVGTDYITVINHFGGTAVDICTADWSSVLNDLLVYSVEKSENKYYLSRHPIEATIEVHIVRNEVTIILTKGQWNYIETENSIQITKFEMLDTDVVDIVYDEDLF